MPALALPLIEEPMPSNGLLYILKELNQSADEAQTLYTGEIFLTNTKNNKTASIFLENNKLVFVSMSGFTIPLAKRLYSGGFLDKEQYDSVQELPTQMVAEKSITEYGVKQTIVEKIYREGFLSLLSFVSTWKDGSTWVWKPESNESHSFVKELTIPSVLENIEKRSSELNNAEKNYPQLANVSLYLDRGPNWEQMIAGNNPAEVISLVSKVDGTRKVSEVAAECGYTKFEMTMFLSQLLGMGAVALNKTSKTLPAAAGLGGAAAVGTPDSWEAPSVPDSEATPSLTPEEEMVAFSAAFVAQGSSTKEESDWGELGQNAKAGQRKDNKQITKKLAIVLGGVVGAVLITGGVMYGPALFGEDPRNSVALSTEENQEEDGASDGGGEGLVAGDQEDFPDRIDAMGSAVEENAIEDDADIVRVKQTIAIPFDKFSSTLSPEQEQEIIAFASQPLDANETVVISGFAGLNAKEEGNAQRISEDRAASIQEVLSQNDINSSIIGYGNTPADSILGEAMQAAIPEDVTHNRLAFVSAVVVKDVLPETQLDAQPSE